MFAKKIALLSEDLLWTQNFFKGYPATEMTKAFPGMEEFAEHLGMEVVYKKALKYKAGMYSPILEEIYRAGADCCVFVASPGNDTDVFAKQWADSSARNMHLSMTAGCGSRFWERTGGKCVGVVYGWGQVPLLTGDHIEIPDINTVAKEHNLILDAAVMFSAYPDIFFIKKAIEKAGGTEDIDALIKAMEETEIKGPVGVLRYQMEKIPPFFHSAVMLDPRNPINWAERGLRIDMGQYQKGGEIVLLSKPFPGVNGSPDFYKSPAELRK